MKLRNIEITKFRGINHLCVDGLGLINVFIGANNVGKSTLLEAVYMLSNMTSIFVPTELNALRDARRGDMAYLKYLFNKSQLSYHPVIVGTTFENKRKRLEISTIGTETSTQEGKTIDFSADSTPITGVELICDDNDQKYTTKLINDNGKLSLNSTITRLDGRKTVFLPSNSREGNILDSYSELVRRQLKDSIIKALQNFDSRITNIEALSDGLYLQFEDMNELIPLSMSGDGVRRYLGIVSYVINPMTDMVLIDEIENGLHYSAYSKLWESLILSAIANKVQLFVTTHSEETLRCLAKVYKKLEQTISSNGIRVYTVDQEVNGEQKAYALSAEGLLGAIESNIEIRK